MSSAFLGLLGVILSLVSAALSPYSLDSTTLSHEDGPDQRIWVPKVFEHPGYDPETKNSDIKLFKLAWPARLNSKVQILVLPNRCPVPGTSCVVSGWGTRASPYIYYPDVLHCANITIVNHDICQSIYPSYSNETMGDTGGPLVCNEMLQGIVLWRHWICTLAKNRPAVYVNVCKYIDWIQETIRSN